MSIVKKINLLFPRIKVLFRSCDLLWRARNSRYFMAVEIFDHLYKNFSMFFLIFGLKLVLRKLNSLISVSSDYSSLLTSLCPSRPFLQLSPRIRRQILPQGFRNKSTSDMCSVQSKRTAVEQNVNYTYSPPVIEFTIKETWQFDTGHGGSAL
jgi:hypothetical protein